MSAGRVRRARRGVLLLLLVCVVGSGCAGAGVFTRDYEYEEELYLALDGSATVHVNASVRSLIALRGADLDPDPRARIDRDHVRTFFGAPDARVTVTLARRNGRRFVHVSVSVDDVRDLSRLAPFSWSAYRFDRRGDVLEFRQTVGSPATSPGGARQVRADPPGMRWTGEEMVAYRMHLPSEIVFHNAPAGEIGRGNILEWEQPLADRLAGRPLDIQVQLTPTSILARTLLLFGATILAAAAALAGLVWWISRRGRDDATAFPAPR